MASRGRCGKGEAAAAPVTPPRCRRLAGVGSLSLPQLRCVLTKKGRHDHVVDVCSVEVFQKLLAHSPTQAPGPSGVGCRLFASSCASAGVIDRPALPIALAGKPAASCQDPFLISKAAPSRAWRVPCASIVPALALCNAKADRCRCRKVRPGHPSAQPLDIEPRV